MCIRDRTPPASRARSYSGRKSSFLLFADAFFILFALFPGRLSGTDKSGAAATLAMRYKDDPMADGIPDCDLPRLSSRMIRIGKRPGKGSRKTVDASSKDTPCLWALAFAFAAFHS